MRLVLPEASTIYLARILAAFPSASVYDTPRTRSSSLMMPVTAHFSRTSAPMRLAWSSRILSNLLRSTWYAYDVCPAILGDTENEKVHGSGLDPHLCVPPLFTVKPACASWSKTPVRRHTPCTVGGRSEERR